MVPTAEMDGYKCRSRLDQAPGQERALSKVVPAIAIAQPRIFPVDVKRPPRSRPSDKLERLLIEPIHRVERAGLLRRAHDFIELLRQRLPILQPLDAQPW